MADLNVDAHDITVREQSTFAPSGQPLTQTIVTFFAGAHGPFTLTYEKKDATPANIKADIKKQQDDLLAVHELGA
jgi:hypothetical protein